MAYQKKMNDSQETAATAASDGSFTDDEEEQDQVALDVLPERERRELAFPQDMPEQVELEVLPKGESYVYDKSLSPSESASLEDQRKQASVYFDSLKKIYFKNKEDFMKELDNDEDKVAQQTARKIYHILQTEGEDMLRWMTFQTFIDYQRALVRAEGAKKPTKYGLAGYGGRKRRTMRCKKGKSKKSIKRKRRKTVKRRQTHRRKSSTRKN
jgi:hypothetical protein